MPRYKKITTPTAKEFSAWYRVGADHFDSCCDCGLVHHNKYVIRVYKKDGRMEIWMRTRRHIARTKARRTRKIADYPFKEQ